MGKFKKTLLLSTAVFCLLNPAWGMEEENVQSRSSTPSQKPKSIASPSKSEPAVKDTSATTDFSTLTITQQQSIDNLSIRSQPLNIEDLPYGEYEIDGTFFKCQNVSGSGMRCFFNAVGLEADIEIAKLQSAQDNLIIRYMIANEIVSAARTPDQLPGAVKSAIRYQLYEAQQSYQDSLEESRSNQLVAQSSNTNQQDPSLLPQALQILSLRNQQILEDLRKRAFSLEAFQTFLKHHIGREQMMVALLDVRGESQDNQNANYTSIDAIAYLNNFGLRIYQPQNGGLRLAHQFIPENANEIVYLYHEGNHFQALMPAPLRETPRFIRQQELHNSHTEKEKPKSVGASVFSPSSIPASNTEASESDTFEKLDEISRQTHKIKKIHEKAERTTEDLQTIKESLLRISWRVEEILGSDKFHMATYFPEKNWLLLGHLSTALNSITDDTQLEAAISSISEEVIAFETIIPIIKKILKKEAPAVKKIELPHLGNLVGYYMDTAFLHKLQKAITTLNDQIEKSSAVEFSQDENNKRAVFRAFEIIGESAKYISKDLKEAYRNIPWLSRIEDSKGNILKTLRNKFHHERERLELIFLYEPQLFSPLVETVIPFLYSEITKLIKERESAFTALDVGDFKALNTSLVAKIKTSDLQQTEKVTKALQDILTLLVDDSPNLPGWVIKDLLSYIKADDRSIYNYLFKKASPPDTEDEFITFVKKVIDLQKSPNGLSEALEHKFRRAYAQLKGKRVSQREIEDALKDSPKAPSIEEIKTGIKRVLLEGERCRSTEFQERFLKPIFFKGIEQKAGEEKLEELRSSVAVNTDPEEIKKLFDLSEEEQVKAGEATYKRFEMSHSVKENLKNIVTLSKVDSSKVKISSLIGLSKEDQQELLRILAKEPQQDIQDEDIRKKFDDSKDVQDKINEILKGGDKSLIKKKDELKDLINIGKKEQDDIWNLIKKDPANRTDQDKQKINDLLAKCPKGLAEHKAQLKEKQRTDEDLEKAKQILEKVPETIDELRHKQEDAKKRITAILLKELVDITEFDNFLSLFFYDPLVNRIKAKHKSIFSSSTDLSKELEALLDTIDDKTPSAYLKEVLENSWLLPSGESDVTEKHLKDLVEDAKFDWKEFEGLCKKKRDHSLTQKDIDGAIESLDSKYPPDEINHKINNLKIALKNLICLSEKSFETLVKKAGYNYKQFEELYKSIISSDTTESLGVLKQTLASSIKKLDSIFEELSIPSLAENERKILKLSAEYLIEEIGLVAETLVNRDDYVETDDLSTSKRNLYLIGLSRKASAHYPLEIDEDLMDYLIDQLVLDTSIRLNSNPDLNLRVSSEALGLPKARKFDRSRRISWKELEEKKVDIYALIEGLGFKSDFKIFGKSLGSDLGIQGDLNLLVDAAETEKDAHPGDLIELETCLGRELNCDVRVYTESTLRKRLGSKVTEHHLENIKTTSTQNLEDVVRGNEFKEFFKADRWSTFKMGDGRIFTRSQYLEQQDLQKVFSFLIRPDFSFEDLETLLNDQENLQRTVQERLDAYNRDPLNPPQQLKNVLLVFSNVVAFYETGYNTFYLPTRNAEGKIIYGYFIPLGYDHDGRLASVKEGSPLLTSDEFQSLSIQVQKLFAPQAPVDSVQTYIRCDAPYKSALFNIEKKQKIPATLSQDIASLLFDKVQSILEVLDPQHLINEEMIFGARTVDYASSQTELDEKRERTQAFRKKRLNDNKTLQDIIRKKSSAYYKAIKDQLESLSQTIRKYILEYVLLDKKTHKLLRDFYIKNQEYLTFLWETADNEQKDIINQLTQSGNRLIQNVISSFFHMFLNIENKLLSITDEKTSDEIKKLNQEKESIIDRMVPELFKEQFPAKLRAGMSVSITGGIGRIDFNPPTYSTLPNINLSYLSNEASQVLAKKYSFMFNPIHDPQVIQKFLDEATPKSKKDALYANLCERYYKGEEQTTTFTIMNGIEEKTGLMVDFSSEVESENYTRRQKNKEALEKISPEVLSTLPRSLQPLIEQRRGQVLIHDQTYLLGFSGEFKQIYEQISSTSHFEQRKLVSPDLLLEGFPAFIGSSTSPNIEMNIQLSIHSLTTFSKAAHDLEDIMDLNGWAEEQKAAYKINHDFEQDNKIIKDYFEYSRLFGDLKSTKLRRYAYEKKLADIVKMLAEPNLTSSQQEKLQEKFSIYQRALARNDDSYQSLIDKILELSHVQRRISEALSDPDFLYDLYEKYTKGKIKVEKVDERIAAEKVRLEKQARDELESMQ